MTRSALLVSNKKKPGATEALAEVRALIGAHCALIGELDGDAGTPAGGLPRADVVVVLGGDGTLLAQARRFASTGAALLGVNFGKVGFLAEFDLPALRRQAKELLSAAQLPVRERMLIEAEIVRADGRVERAGLAINECVVTAGPPYRMISLDIAIDGQPGPSLTGDGVIVATPVGSTAYNVSAGGPIVSPDLAAMIITPLAAHSLSFRPIVMPERAEVAITITRANAPARGAAPESGTTLVLDGSTLAPLSAGDRLLLRRHAHAARLVINRETSYWRTLIAKMHWASAPGAGTDATGGKPRGPG